MCCSNRWCISSGSAPPPSHVAGLVYKQGNESAPPSPKKARIDDGKAREFIKIDVDSILAHLLSLQDTKKLSHRVNHSDKERFIELKGRDTTVSQAVSLLKRSCEAYKTNTADRTNYPFIVFNGMSGLGKTRMLEEGLGLLPQAGITEPCHTALVMYGNGTPVCDFDRYLPIVASFSWRLLHGLFVEGNCKDGETRSWTSPKFLPENAA